jgi:hypothetical protein
MKRIGVLFFILLFFFFTDVVFATGTPETLHDKEFELDQAILTAPLELSREKAYDLITGKRHEVRVRDWERDERATYVFGFPAPVIKERKEIPEKVISFSNGKWNVKSDVEVVERPCLLFTFFFLVIPFAGILIVTLRNQKLKIGNKKLFIFYLVLLASTLVAVLVNILADKIVDKFANELAFMDKIAIPSIGLGVGIFVSGMANAAAGLFAGDDSKSSFSAYPGMVTGALVGLFADIMYKSWDNIGCYLILLTVMAAVSFALPSLR